MKSKTRSKKYEQRIFLNRVNTLQLKTLTIASMTDSYPSLTSEALRGSPVGSASPFRPNYLMRIIIQINDFALVITPSLWAVFTVR
jgi:hypothetical protein